MIRQIFTCPKCRKTSANPNDAKERYCGACHVFVAVVEDWSMRGWTVYFRPLDFPKNYVVREWRNTKTKPVITQAMPEAFVADTLEEIRRAVPPGLCRLNREPADDANIVEVWI